MTANVTLTIAALLVCQSVLAKDIRSADRPRAQGTQGEWSAPFDLGIVAINAALLQNGKVLFWQFSQGPRGGSRAKLWDPSGLLTDVSVPYDRDIFCGGQIHLADGRLMVIGGVKWHHSGSEVGVKQTDFFDPTTETWSPGPEMSYARWYPDVLEYADGTLLAIGGQRDDAHLIVQIERYDPVANAFATLPQSASKSTGVYPRTVLLPDGRVFLAGQNQDTDLLDLDSNRWSLVGNFNYGERLNGLTVILPDLNQIMAIGGGGAEGNKATATAEIIDFSVPTPSWQYTASMHFPRANANAVLLPDGTVLVIGGAREDSYKRPVNAAEVFNPVDQTWTVLASSQAPKAHHSTALLLPDGRVWSAGGDSHLPLQTSGQLFSPPYLFKGPQPVISDGPQTLAYNQVFSISTTGAPNIARVALIKLGAATHAGDFDQRYVDLTFQEQSGALQVTSPGDSNQAPPGWYMLFIVTGDGVPSVASMILLE